MGLGLGFGWFWDVNFFVGGLFVFFERGEMGIILAKGAVGG
jgi:hypothetical protein